jgi:glycosyltransferase involved in cell wall biosynthesis
LPIHQIIDKSNELINNKLINSDYIVMVARLDKQKDHATLFKAFVEVNKSHPNLNLVLLGDGGEKESLKILSAQLGLEDRIYFLGSVENPYAWIKNAKALILSTNYEGFGLVIIESICVNTVPIVSDIPQCLEAINHHKCGISFENHNAFDLVEKINLVLNNKYDKQTFLSERDKFLYRFISDTINVEFNTMVQVVLNNKREFN